MKIIHYYSLLFIRVLSCSRPAAVRPTGDLEEEGRISRERRGEERGRGARARKGRLERTQVERKSKSYLNTGFITFFRDFLEMLIFGIWQQHLDNPC
mgnify:CR=1 FL=1